jgi:hypothetical protein
MKLIQKIINIVLTISLFGCVSIPAGKVKLDDYPEVKKEEMKNLDLGFKVVNYEKRENLDSNFLTVNKELENNNTSCIAEISSRSEDKEVRNLNVGDLFRIPYYLVCQLSLAIIPCYYQNDFEARATLISTKDNKILKEYNLKDKTHEVWSLFFAISNFGVENKYISVLKHSEVADQEIEQTISEALTRQILHDASTFPECHKKKKGSSVFHQPLKNNFNKISFS